MLLRIRIRIYFLILFYCYVIIICLLLLLLFIIWNYRNHRFYKYCSRVDVMMAASGVGQSPRNHIRTALAKSASTY